MFTNEQSPPLALMPPSNQETSTELMPYTQNNETTNFLPLKIQAHPQQNNETAIFPLASMQAQPQQNNETAIFPLASMQAQPQQNNEMTISPQTSMQSQPQQNNETTTFPLAAIQFQPQQSNETTISPHTAIQFQPQQSNETTISPHTAIQFQPQQNNETTNYSLAETQIQPQPNSPLANNQQQQPNSQQSYLQRLQKSFLSRMPFLKKLQPSKDQQQDLTENDEKKDENTNIPPWMKQSNENAVEEDQLEKYSTAITNFVQNPDQNPDRQLESFTDMSKILPDDPDPKIIEKWNTDYLDKSRDIKDKLYEIVQSMTTDDVEILNCMAISIGKLSLIEYQKNFWQQDFDIIMDQLLQIKNPENSIPKPTVYIFLKVIYMLLSNGMPFDDDPLYDEKVSNIVEILNIYLSQDYENFKYQKEIKEIILKSIKESLKIFRRYFNNIYNFKAQLDHLMSLIDMFDKVDKVEHNYFELIYDCFNLSIMNYYAISHSIMGNLFKITLSHLLNEEKYLYSLKFWSVVAQTEKEIDLETSKHYILGFIKSPKNYIQNDLLPLTKYASPEIDINEPEDDELNNEKIIIECIQSIFKAEPELMFKILSQYFKDHSKNEQLENRLSALIVYYCIINSFENEENGDHNQIVDFIEKTLPDVIGFIQKSNAKLMYYSLNIIKISMTKFPSFITSNRKRINDIFSILLKKKVQPSLVLEIYDIFALMLENISPSNLDLIGNNFNELYSFISLSYSKDSNFVNEATKYSKALIEKAPEECDQLIFEKLNEYVSVDEPSNEFSNKDKIQLYLLPVFMEKLQKNPNQKKLTNDYILKIVNKILELFISNKMMYDEILEAVVKIIPFTKQISFSKFGQELIKHLIENHKSDDSVTKKSTCYAFAALIEHFPNEMQYYIKEILKLVMNDLKSETLLQRAYPPIFYLTSSIVKAGIFSDAKYSDYSNNLIDRIKKKVSSFSFKKEDLDQELFDLCFEILNCYLALLDAFKSDDKMFNLLEKPTILFIKKLEVNDFCYNDLLESSIKIIFIILCKKKIDSFQILSQPILNKIIVRGSEYEGDEDIRSVSIKMLNIFTNYC